MYEHTNSLYKKYLFQQAFEPFAVFERVLLRDIELHKLIDNGQL